MENNVTTGTTVSQDLSNQVDTTKIKQFLEGQADTKYIVGIEAGYTKPEVILMFDHPEKGKYMEKHKYTPFLFCKDFKASGKQLYKTTDERNEAIKRRGIKIKKLRTDGDVRLENGQKYLVETAKGIGDLINFFKQAGHDVYGRGEGNMFVVQQPAEQFLISTGKRLFKGFEKYSDVHKFYFDIETTGLDPKDSNIFLLGMRDNRGFEKVLEIDLNNPLESERQMIVEFFLIINELKPSIIAGYNSEAFDFHFIIERAKTLGLDLGSKDEEYKWHSDIPTSLNPELPLRRKESFIKFGGEQEKYIQTIMWGYNVVDISHAVRRAMAINSDIKSWGLKYVCKYAKVAKKNRMYVDGAKIYNIWQENKLYFINPEDSQYVLAEGKTKPEGWEEINGKEIINRYLLDDLYETEQVDEVFNQQAFMMGAIVPAAFARTSTMGTAVLWKLLMCAYSYENGLAIPKTQEKKDFVGGLSRLFRVGYSKNVLKMDFASLYPSIQLTHDVFPTCDVTGALKQMLTYFRDARNMYKKMGKKAKGDGNEEMAKLYDTKQLPIKILNNSLFGALSAPDVFPWGDMDCGERITCTGRQYLRSMIKHFINHGFAPTVTDTDGCDLAIPDNIETVEYKGKKGYHAVLEMFNENLPGVMEVSEDGTWKASINMARKNYANLYPDDKIKFVGNTIKSKKLSTYMEIFFDNAIKFLLDGDGKGFVEYYYEYLSKIYNKQIPLIQIANKGRVKITLEAYKKKSKELNKAGKPLPKQAHMELLLSSGTNPSLGEVVYYVNNGSKKSHGDTGNSYLIHEKDFEANPNLTGDYNVSRAVATFNKRLQPLLICFKPEIRSTLLIENPRDRQFYTSSQVELISGVPFDEANQDVFNSSDYKHGVHENEPLFEMSENEIKFWNRTNLSPFEIFSAFTTDLSTIKLKIGEVNGTVLKIKNKFKDNGIDVKWYNEKYSENDMVITMDGDTFFLNEVKRGDLIKIDKIEI